MIIERPILFSGSMVRAILDGRKTQTRRVVKNIETLPNGMITPKAGYVPRKPENHIVYCPHGRPGDRLWVRETFAYVGTLDPGYLLYRADDYESQCKKYRFDSYPDEAEMKWKPSIFMPKVACRLFLEITNVRVERLQDIEYEDALSEGTHADDDTDLTTLAHLPNKEMPSFEDVLVASFANLWDSINAKKHPWESNPWVWAIEFKRVDKEGV